MYLGTLIWVFIYLQLYYILDVLTSLSLYNYILCLLLPFLAGSLFCLTSSFCFHLDGLSSSLSNLNLGLSIWMKWKPCKQRQFSSVTQSCLILCDPMNRSMPGLPVHHKLPEFTQTQAHLVGDDIQPSHPLSSPSPLAPNPSQHQGLFQRVNSSHQVAKVLEFQLQHQSFQWTPRTDIL